MQTKKPKPWLTPSGVEIPTSQLKQICKAWDRDAWDAYLKWYESSRRESLLPPDQFDTLANHEPATIFEKFGQSTDQRNRLRCESLLCALPHPEARVLRLKFFEGRTEREIAAIQETSKTTVHRLKDRAFLRLRRGHDGEKWTTRRLMRGEASDANTSPTSIWTQTSSFPIKEAKVYDPAHQKEEFEKIQNHALRVALRELSERQQQTIYLHFWCDFSVSEIARDLRCGMNLTQQVLDAAISKIKRRIIQIETGYSAGGGPSCA